MKFILDGNWLMEKKSGEKAEARVPGSVYESLLNAGLIEDPFWRDNEEEYYKICEDDCSFSRTFEADEILLSKDDATLVCEGIDTLAEIFINDRSIGKTENMHRTYIFPIKDDLRSGENSIRIEFKSPVRYAGMMDMKDPLWGTNHTMPGYQHIRKGHYMFGWDWGPILPDIGIWKSIYITASDTARLEDVHFKQDHGSDRVVLSAEIKVHSFREADITATMHITHPDGAVTKAEACVKHNTCGLQAAIENPELWWPNGYGDHKLYQVKISINDGVELDSKEYEIGLRTVELSARKDQWGREFTFIVNGIGIFAMGANYIPQDNLLGRCTREKSERLIRDCVDANYNMLRVWGGGLYADDVLLDLCDRYGILVWQDFMFACALYDLTDDFRVNITREFEDNIKRMRHHACLALWCGNNEIEAGLTNWGIPHNEKLRADYVEMFERLIPRLLKEYDPDRSYWPSSPSSYGGFDKPGDVNHGDTHYWDVWHGTKPFEDYKNHYFRFCSEFGFQSFPSMRTIESFTLPEDRNVFSYVMERHQKNTSANGKLVASLADNYPYPRDLKQLVYGTQLLQAEAIGFGVEHMRRNRGRCMGATYWQVNDCWPVASWASIDYYGRWKALHYAAKRFFAPVLLSCDNREGLVTLNVSNELRRPFKGFVNWYLRDNSGRVLKEGSAAVEMGALSARNIIEIDIKDDIADKNVRMRSYLEYELIENDRTVSVGACLFIKPKHYIFVDPKISIEIEDSKSRFTIRLRSKAYARYVELSVADADAIFSDNYFDLTPEREKVITVLKDRISCDLSLEELKKRLGINSVFNIA